MLKHKYVYVHICNEQYIYIYIYIYKGESVISTHGIRKGIMNSNMNMKNIEYKMDERNIAYIMKEHKT